MSVANIFYGRRRGSLQPRGSVFQFRSSSIDISPLNRKDAFYEGSIASLVNVSKDEPVDLAWNRYRMSIVTVENEMAKETEHSSIWKVLHHEVFMTKKFLAFGLARFIGDYGVFFPVSFLPSNSPADASMFIAIFGLTNLVGRMVGGVILTKFGVGALKGTTLGLMVVFISVVTLPFCSSFLTFAISSGALGLFASPYHCMHSLIAVDLFGIEKLSVAFAGMMVFRGCGSFIGPVTSGALVDLTGGYLVPCTVAAGTILLSISLHASLLWLDKD